MLTINRTTNLQSVQSSLIDRGPPYLASLSVLKNLTRYHSGASWKCGRDASVALTQEGHLNSI